MTWLKFAIWLLMMYAGYYGVLIFWDRKRSGGNRADEGKQELTFVEDSEPEKAYTDELPDHTRESPVAFSGGVSLKQLFNLAREESVDYIKAVSF